MSIHCPTKKIKENSAKMLDAVEAVEGFDEKKIKEIFVNDYFTNGKQKTSEWAWLGQKGRNVENWINRVLFAATKDKTTKAVNQVARKTIKLTNDVLGSDISDDVADILVEENSPFRKLIDNINADMKLENSRIDQWEHRMNNTLKRYDKETITKVAKALDGRFDKNALNENELTLYSHLRELFDEEAKKLVKLGVLKEEHLIQDYLKHYFTAFENEASELRKAFSKGVGLDKTFKRKELSDEELEKLGIRFDTFGIIKTYTNQLRQRTKAEFLEKLANEFGSDEAKQGWVKISDETLAGGVKKYGALGGKYVHPDMARFIHELEVVGATQNALLKALTKLGSVVKTNMTALNPGTHVFNVLSNLKMALINGDLLSVVTMAKQAKAGGAVFKKWKKLGEWYGYNGNMSAIDFGEGQKGLSANVQKARKAYNVASNAWLGENSALGKVFRESYNLEDGVFKLAHFKRLMDSTDFDINKAFLENGELNLGYLKEYEEPLRDAMRRGNYQYVDYSTRWSKLVQAGDRAAITPFIQYTWKATPMMLRTIAQNPLKFTAVTLGSGGYFGFSLGEDNKAENILLPKYGQTSGPFGLGVSNLFLDRNWVRLWDSDYYFNLGRSTPGIRLDGFNGVNFSFGFLGSLGHILQGETPLGYKFLNEDDSGLKQNWDIAKELARNFAPGVSVIGRYGQDAMALAFSDKKPKDSLGQDLSWGDYFLKIFGVRRMPQKAEAQKKLNEVAKKLKVAKKEKDADKIKELTTQYNFILKVAKKNNIALKEPRK